MATPSDKPSILIVDDHLQMARLLADQLGDLGYDTRVASDGEEALALARSRLPDVAITDLRMNKVDGMDVLDGLHAMDPALPVIIMTAFGALETAIDAIKRGAYHYFTKPLQLEEVRVFVARALDDRRLRDANRSLRRVALERGGLGALVGRSQAMRDLYELIERVAASQAPVLIRGESGTGKELVARALHFEGARREAPFVAVNCTALPEALLESELFGHVRGAFTGATAARRGLFVEADGGSLFLDEIGDMAPSLQAKLLRVLEDGKLRPVGADQERKVDVRIVAATHQDLEPRIQSGAFRSDLYFRLNVVPLRVPPLRERREDIPLLVEHFLARARQRNPTARLVHITPDAIARMTTAAWPGNVRELENLLERLVIICPSSEIDLARLDQLTPGLQQEVTPLDSAKDRMLSLRQLESEYIAWVIGRCGGNKTRAAEVLGIDVSTIHRRERGT